MKIIPQAQAAFLACVLLCSGCASGRSYNYEVLKKALKQDKKKDKAVVIQKELKTAKTSPSRSAGKALLDAAMQDEAAWIIQSVNAGADVDIADEQGWTALIWTVYNGGVESAKILLNNKADVNKCDKDGRSPLMWAVFENNRMMVELLLENGAFVNGRDVKGWTPLLYSFSNSSREIIESLLNKGAEFILTGDVDLGELLCVGAKKDSALMLRFLLEHGADADYRGRSGSTALMYAAASGSTEAAKTLIEAGADINAADKDGWTALRFASANSNEQVAEILKMSGAAE